VGKKNESGLLLFRRAQVVGVLGLFSLALSEVTLGCAYRIWWTFPLHGRVLIAELVAVLLWIATDPRGFGKVIAAIPSLAGRVNAWAESLGSPAQSYGAHRAEHIDEDDRAEQEKNQPTPASDSEPESQRLGLHRLAQWYEAAPAAEERPIRWFLLWLLVSASLYMINVVIAATGGGLASPFIQIPLLAFVLGGMMSDAKYHLRLILGFGVVYTVILLWVPALITPGAPGVLSQALDAEMQKKAFTIVTPIVTALGVWQSYLGMGHRRTMHKAGRQE
jgi:hypothetical protein